MLQHGSQQLITSAALRTTASDYTPQVLEQIRRSSRLLQSRSALPAAQLVEYVSVDPATGRESRIYSDRPPTVPAVELPQRETAEEVAELHAAQDRRRTGYALQREAARLAGGERVALCHRLVHSASKAEIRRHNGKAYFANLQTCGSVWMCPVCAAKITEARRRQLQTLVEKHRANGGTVAMLTLTIPHTRHDVLRAPAARKVTQKRTVIEVKHQDVDVPTTWEHIDFETGEITVRHGTRSGTSAGSPVNVHDLEHDVIRAEDHGIVSRLTGAYRAFVSGRGALSRVLPGYVGYVRALEVTTGANGWHPHLHVLVLLDGELSPVQVAMLEDHLHVSWADKVRHAGLGEISRAGLRFELSRVAGLDRDPVTDYLTKWGAAEELTKLHTKKGQKAGTDGKKGRSPWQLLAAAQDGDRAAGAAWAEYAQAFKGRRQLVPSRGLWDQFGLEDLSDLQLSQAQPEQHETVVILERAEWVAVRACGDRSTILDLAEYGADQVERYVLECLMRWEEKYGSLEQLRAGDPLEREASLVDSG